MKKYTFFMLSILSFFSVIRSEEFIYPVASFDNGNQLLVMYQKSLEDIQLWIWDTQEQYAIRGLLSSTTPANVRILPSGSGFSFIDSGYIKIKEFTKRSAKTIPIYEPIGLFSSMHWVDENFFYFVAREGDFFQIFQSDIQANVKRLTYDAADALYPQKVGRNLFYIKRCQENNQSFIMCKEWNPIALDACIPDMHFHENIIVEHYGLNICFLKMINHKQGFFLQAPTSKASYNKEYRFDCYHLSFENNVKWVYEKIFEFTIPTKYITGPDRMYESVEPFLPNYTNNSIYFVDWQNQLDTFDLVKFDLTTKNKKSIDKDTFYKNQKIFSPYAYQNKIYCGLILPEGNPIENHFLKKENPYFQLPFFYKN